MSEGVSIVAIIGVFFVPAAMIVAIVWFRSNVKTKRYHLQAELAVKAIEKGQPIPVDLFKEFKSKRNLLSIGSICIAAGIGISIFLWLAIGIELSANEAGRVASLGVIPFLIGVAYVVVHFIEKKQTVGEDVK